MIYTYHHNTQGPIKSVYEHENEAKRFGLIKEMIFVAPENHDVPPINKNMAGMSPKAGKKKRKQVKIIKDGE